MDKIIVFLLMVLAFLGISFYRPNAINKPSINYDYKDKEEIEKTKRPPVIEKKPIEKEPVKGTETEYSNIKEIKPSDLKNIKGKYILVLTGTTCPHCKTYKPILNEILVENNLEAYEIDMWVLEEDDKKLVTDVTGDVYGVPTTVIVEDGKQISRKEGSLSESNAKDFLKSNGFIN